MRVCNCSDTLNYYINHSSIYPLIAEDHHPEYLDADDLLAKRDTHFLLFDGGGLLFFKVSDNVYQGDIYFLSRQRGLKAKDAAKQALDYMFSKVGADKIIARVPDFNEISKKFTANLGFKRVKVEPLAWLRGDIKYDVICYELGKE